MDGPAPYSRAVAGVRERLAQGHVPPGASLVVGEIAQALDLSPTPVREALARLAGEGIIEDRRGKGYFAWPLTASDILELYQMRHGYLRLALEFWTFRGAWIGTRRVITDGGGLPGGAHALFDQIVAGSGNQILWDVYGRHVERMALLHRIEGDLLDQRDEEASALQSDFEGADLNALLSSLQAYHDRRQHWAGVFAGAAQNFSYR